MRASTSLDHRRKHPVSATFFTGTKKRIRERERRSQISVYNAKFSDNVLQTYGLLKRAKTMKYLASVAALCCACLVASVASSQEAIIGVGATDYPDSGNDNEIISLEYVHSPFFERSSFAAALAANASITSDSDWFVGAGVALRWQWQSGWFAEGSFMPGYYEAGTSGNDLGNDLEFRSLIGLGYRFDSGRSLSLAITHKSNASISSDNPGADAILLRYHVPLGS